ncbi:hypothetical protein ACIQMV_32830 [Streptomyces sp. NPDC091412]|uniref:hypothetical protein n=1 Tax=Streptomyces sp. NPDC091412 TaxID=3366002 RepID=UPI003815238A
MPTPTRAEEALAAVLAGVPRPSEENGDLRILDSWTVGEDTICVAYQGWWEDGTIGLRRRIDDDLPVSWVVGQILDAELGEPPGGLIEGAEPDSRGIVWWHGEPPEWWKNALLNPAR